MPLQKFRIVGGKDHSDQKALEEARKRARPILRKWLNQVEEGVVAKRLQPIDYLLCKELTNYPSANEGRCYAGQARLGRAIGRCARHVRRSLKRLCDEGLLLSKRGGGWRTASWSFCFQHSPIFQERQCVAATATAGLDRPPMSGLERPPMSAKPSELKPIEHKPSPLIPTNGGGGTTVRLPMKETWEATVIAGEDIIREMPFREFWEAIGRRGKEGFARAEWRKLVLDDKVAIADWLRAGQTTNLWAGVWLRDKVWEEPTANNITNQPIEHSLGDAGDRLRSRFGDDLFASWFGNARIEEATDKVIKLSVPTKFLKNWISTHYGDAVLDCWKAGNQLIERVDITVRP